MKYEIIEPPKILKKYVRYFSTLDFHSVSSSPNHIKVFADRYPHLVFQHDNGKSAFHVNGNSLPTTFLSGIKTRPFTVDINSTHSVTTVTLYPHAIKILFGIDVFDLNNELPEIQNFAPKYLDDQLLHTENHVQRIAILTEFLSTKLLKLKQEDHPTLDDIKWFGKINVETTLPYLQKHLNISERQLERRFKAAMGLPPKQYLRTMRFEKALALVRNNNFENLSDIAYHLNFTDQSHFIKDFKEFSGYTPKTLLNQNRALEESSTLLKPDDGEITLNHLITY
jgi:AraC-like DNA-binding protein